MLQLTPGGRLRRHLAPALEYWSYWGTSEMQQILIYVKDPGWWFSAFFVAIIASVIAGFAKDRVASIIGSLSESHRARQLANVERRRKMVAALAENEGFLILTMIRTSTLTLFSLLVFVIFLASPMLSMMFSNWCQLVPVDPTCKVNDGYLSIIVSFVAGVATVVTAYLGSSHLTTTMLGYRGYLKRRGLPKGL